ALPTAPPTATSTATPTLSPTATLTVTPSPLPPSETPQPTNTATITPSPTFTPSPTPTPVYALVDAPPEYGGAIVRVEPGFSKPYLTSLSNGTLVEILTSVPVEAEKALWHNVRLNDGREGWMVQTVLLVATPAPNW
ncbi:MAG: SH3 domain-containing protein, partial [Anaerolineales bacterium]|nr:SH3 domain-containing protein [Anaerolineales bacterium]